jgi:lambda family phage portal protein
MMEIRPNLMDRMVAAFSPARGLQRMAARASLAAATALTAPRSGSPTDPGGRIFGRGGYNGGQRNRRQTRGWFARNRSANADTLGDQRTLIARSRDAAMNMPLATAAIERPITFTVGTGLMAIPSLDAKALGLSEEQALELGSTIGRDFDNYMSSTDPDAERTATGYDQQEIVLRGVLESGDIAGVRVMPSDQIGRRHETAWKLYEADRIVSPANHAEGMRLGSDGVGTPRGAQAGGNVCAGGVEVDEYAAPLAYHLLKAAPDSFGGMAISARVPGDTVRIEAWGKESELPTVVHVMAKRRPEQFRGVSILAPVLEALHQVSTLTDAELFAAILQSMIAIVYKSPGAQQMPEPEYGPPGTGDISVTGANPAIGLDDPARPELNARFEAGTVLEIDTEAGAEMKSPGRPNPAFDPFFLAMAKQIAAALEIPLEILLLSFTHSYSASRGALEVFYLTVRKRRGWLASHWCTPVYAAWLYEQVAKGRYSMPGFLTDPLMRERWSNVSFRGDGKISLDPTREAKALEVHEAHAWSTGAQITAELNGGDYEANVRQRGGENKRFVAAGLPLPNAQGGGVASSSDYGGVPSAGGDRGSGGSGDGNQETQG